MNGSSPDPQRPTSARADSYRLAGVLEAIGDAVITVDGGWNIVDTNRAAESMFGWPPGGLIGQPLAVLLPPEVRDAHGRWARAWVDGGSDVLRRSVMAAGRAIRARCRDGREVPVQIHLVRLQGTDDDRVVAVVRDVSEAVRAQELLQAQKGMLQAVADAIPSMVSMVDSGGVYLFVNQAFARWLGRGVDGIVGQRMSDVLGDDGYAQRRPWIARALQGETVRFELETDSLHGKRHVAIAYSPIRQPDGRIGGLMAIWDDITEQKTEHLRLVHMTQRDPLTGLLNRSGFELHMDAIAREGTGPATALLYIDLDEFKPVNDRYGHPVGDRLLQAFGRRLQEQVRPTDAVSRLGGDEFAVTLGGVRRHADAMRVAQTIVQAAMRPFELDGQVLQVGASVGVAFGMPAHGDWQDLVRRADGNLLAAKAAGRGRCVGEDERGATP